MGYSGFELEDNPKVESISYTEYFEKACPVFMLYGLSYEDFWYGDPFKAKYQMEVYKLRLKEKDEIMWEQGMYIYEAILQCSPILHPFSKAQKPLPYTEMPHLSQLDVEQSEKEKQQEIENERLKAQIWINNWAKSMQKHFENN